MRWDNSNKWQTKDNAYLLGLLYADGCLYQRKNRTQQYRLGLTIGKKDKSFVKELKAKYPFFTLSLVGNVYRFETGRQNIASSVIKYIPQRKSYENANKLRLPKKYKYIWDFVRGFFDGDGNADKSSAEITCVSKQFTTDLSNLFKSKNISHDVKKRIPKRKRDKQILYRLRLRKQGVIILYELMYKNHTICLERKRKLLNEFAKRSGIKLPKYICPICKNKSLMKMGSKGNRQRWFCKICNTTSTNKYKTTKTKILVIEKSIRRIKSNIDWLSSHFGKLILVAKYKNGNVTFWINGVKYINCKKHLKYLSRSLKNIPINIAPDVINKQLKDQSISCVRPRKND